MGMSWSLVGQKTGTDKGLMMQMIIFRFWIKPSLNYESILYFSVMEEVAIMS